MTQNDLVIADSSDQRTIDYLQSEGFNIQSAVKGPGSVKAGINWLQGYKIVINPRCSLTGGRSAPIQMANEPADRRSTECPD